MGIFSFPARVVINYNNPESKSDKRATKLRYFEASRIVLKYIFYVARQSEEDIIDIISSWRKIKKTFTNHGRFPILSDIYK